MKLHSKQIAFWAVPLAAIGFLANSTSVQAANCNIRDFLIRDWVNSSQSSETELSFVLTSTREEFDKAKQSGALSGAYGLISGSGSWEDAKERAQRIAEATSFDFRSSYASSYFSQTVWPGAVEAYKSCLNSDQNSAGLTLWLSQREGDYYTFQAFWVGTNLETPAATLSDAIVDGGRIVAKPDSWIKGKIEDVVVKRDGNNDLFLSLTVGDQKKSFVVVKDPPAVVWKERLIVSPKVITVITSYSNPCTAGTDNDAIYALAPGGFFVQGTEDFAESTSDRGTYSEDLKYGPRKITVKVTQSTGACEHRQTAGGQLKAIERYPTSASQQP
ncbi:hypothetical protein ACC817_28670 [Rhizobium ruizarguesonis]